MTLADKDVPHLWPGVPRDVTVCALDGAVLVGATDGTFVRDPLIGQVVGEYQVVRRIGAGGMGIVYEAVHPIIGKRAAVKVLRPETAEDPDQMARLLAEAKAIAAIHHQAVIDIFGFGQLPDGRHYMVMAYLDGEGLDVVLERQRKLPLADALNVLEQIASGLGAAHAVGVVHRDLKPSNVDPRAARRRDARGEGAGLRPRQGRSPQPVHSADERGPRARHARVHGARAGPRRRRRPAQRSLRAWGSWPSSWCSGTCRSPGRARWR